MNAKLIIAPNREATLREYIAMRDCVWRLLKDPKNRTASGIEYLELCNGVVKLILDSQPETMGRMLELLQCDVCELFIVRSRRELRAENRQSPRFLTDQNEVADLLKIALEPDTETIATPAPSSVLPIRAS